MPLTFTSKADTACCFLRRMSITSIPVQPARPMSSNSIGLKPVTLPLPSSRSVWPEPDRPSKERPWSHLIDTVLPRPMVFVSVATRVLRHFAQDVDQTVHQLLRGGLGIWLEQALRD